MVNPDSFPVTVCVHSIPSTGVAMDSVQLMESPLIVQSLTIP